MTEGLILLSASQINFYRECARKWAWRYLAKIETPQHHSAALGQEVDDEQLQPYLRDARPIDYTRESGYIAAAGLAHLPKPQTLGMEIQKHFVLPSPTWREHGFGYQGYIDLWLPDSSLSPGMPGGAPYVGDFKTTSNVEKWSKSKKALSTDVQAMTYATDAMYETGARVVDLDWIYFQTRDTRKTKRVHLRVVADQVAEQFGHINETAIEMKGIRDANPSPLDLPPTPSQCEAYGGCPYRAKCNLSPSDIIDAHAAKATRELATRALKMANTTTNLFEQLKAKQAQAAIPQTPPDVSPDVSPELAKHIAENPRSSFLLEGAAPINPPESKLDPAPPINVATPTQEATEAPKRRGRGPAKPPTDPKGADIAMHTGLPSPADGGEMIKIAKALRAGCDAFLAAMGAT